MFGSNNWEVQTKFYCIVVMTVGERAIWVLSNFANFSTVFSKKYKRGENFSLQKILQAYDSNL